MIIKTDVQGAQTIKRLNPEAVFVFLAPPSLEELERRLRDRRSEASVDLERRLETARLEMERLPMFDYVVVNESGAIDEAAQALGSHHARRAVALSPPTSWRCSRVHWPIRIPFATLSP